MMKIKDKINELKHGLKEERRHVVPLPTYFQPDKMKINLYWKTMNHYG